MKRFIILLLLLTITIPTIAKEQKWEPLMLVKNTQIYIDTTSIQKEPNYYENVYSYWTKMYDNKLSTIRDPETDLYYDYIKTKWLINCTTRESVVTETNTYYKNSNIIDTFITGYQNKKWNPPLNTEFDRNSFHYVCTNPKGY